MTLEQQVVSLELAKKMKELGFKQESLFYWSKPFDVNNKFTGEELEPVMLDWLEYHEMEQAIVCSAYTVAELGEMLPRQIKNKSGNFLYLELMLSSSDIIVGYVGDFERHREYADTEANTRAKMLIYLKEDNSI